MRVYIRVNNELAACVMTLVYLPASQLWYEVPSRLTSRDCFWDTDKEGKGI